MKLPIGCLIAAGALCGMLYSQPANPQPEPPKTDCVLSGQVVNAATGEPLKKATVTLYRQDSLQYQPRQKDVDAEGRFAFDDLAPGRYALSASRSGFTTQAYGAKRPGGRGGNPLTLLPKQEMKDLRINLTPHGVVIGRVVDEDGDPRVGVPVSAIKSEWRGSRRQMVPYGTANTNDLGEYRLFGVPPGSFWIQASRQHDVSMPEPNFSAKPEEDYVTTYYPGTMDSNTAAQLQVRSGVELRGIDIKMVKARVVRVRGNVVSGASGGPVRAFVMMMPKESGWGGFMDVRQATVMDAKGAFEFRGVTAGQYAIMANFGSPDGQMTAFQTVNVTDQPVTSLTVVMRPGVAISGTVITEGEEAAKNPDKDKGNAGAISMPLTLVLQPGEQGTVNFMGGGSAPVKEDGTFTLKSIHPGRYRVNAYGGGDGYLKSARFGSVDVLADGLEIPEGGVSGALEVVRSSKGAEVSGTLQDDKDKPLPGATAVLLPEEKYRDQVDRFVVGTADQYGAFTIKNVRPGKYKLIAIESAEGTEWMDPEFVKPYEKKAIALTLEEGQKEMRQLTVRSRAAAEEDKQ